MTDLVIFDWYGTLYDKNLGLFSDSLRTLKELKSRKINMGLVSKTKTPEIVKTQLRETGLADFFDEDNLIIDLEKNASQFLYLMHHFNTDAHKTAVVGDRAIANREIHYGNQLRCSTYWIQRGEHAQELPTAEVGNPTKIITTVSDILDYL